jgi:histidinol-phosphatase (PHP family)
MTTGACALSDLPRYFELVQEAREALPGFPIRLALECDHIEGYQQWIDETAGMAEWDYLIGSVHYIHDGVAVDDPKHVSRWKAPRTSSTCGACIGSSTSR